MAGAMIMTIYVHLLLLVTALANVDALSVRKPPLGCENCRKGQICVRDYKIRCTKTPCRQYRCITPKPGLCPASKPTHGSCIARCRHDGDCKGPLKCCGRCQRKCTLPVKRICTPKCRIGYVCAPKYAICVKPPCAPLYACVSTRPKPGVCPKISSSAVVKRCRYDQQCYGRTKCCHGRCLATPLIVDRCGGCRPGYACVRVSGLCKPGSPCLSHYRCISTRIKPGVCPRTGYPLVGVKCGLDQQCYGRKKCCRGRCVDPVVVDKCGGCKSGYACGRVIGLCKPGSPCLSYFKCVSTRPKLGRCPRPTPGVAKVVCRYDSQCHGFLKCCGGRCVRPMSPCRGCKSGYACVPVAVCKKQPCSPIYRCVRTKPKLGHCPRFTTSPANVACRYDSQCVGWWKCCRGRCVRPTKVDLCGGCKQGQACVAMSVLCVKKPCHPRYRCVSTKPKPGVCPKLRSSYGGCRYDGECYAILKCCNGKCMAPGSRPGRCPSPPPKKCLQSKKDECHHDRDCKEPMKCCRLCHKRCLIPRVENKPGLCPLPRGRCTVPNKPKGRCRNDYQCVGVDKCCRDSCGVMACLGPVTRTIG